MNCISDFDCKATLDNDTYIKYGVCDICKKMLDVISGNGQQNCNICKSKCSSRLCGICNYTEQVNRMKQLKVEDIVSTTKRLGLRNMIDGYKQPALDLKELDNNIQLTKICMKCNKQLSFNEFYKSGKYYASCCKTCTNMRKRLRIKYHNLDDEDDEETDIDEVEKNCRICKETLPIDNFYKDSYSKDGFQNCCKKCRTKKYSSQKRKDLSNVCGKCGMFKPDNFFHKNSEGMYDYQLCIDCKNVDQSK